MSSASALACLQKVSAEILNGGRSEPWKQGRRRQVSEAQIAVHWREEEYYHPPAKFIAQANAADPSIFERFSEEHFPECFKEYADLLSWDAYWHTTLDTSNPPFWKWFVGGRLNACYNCVDRHLATEPQQGGVHLGARAGDRRDQGDHLPGAATAGSTSSPRCCATSAGAEGRRPGDVPPADGPRAAGLDARLRPPRASSTPRCSAGSAVRRAATGSPTREATSW